MHLSLSFSVLSNYEKPSSVEHNFSVREAVSYSSSSTRPLRPAFSASSSRTRYCNVRIACRYTLLDFDSFGEGDLAEMFAFCKCLYEIRSIFDFMGISAT